MYKRKLKYIITINLSNGNDQGAMCLGKVILQKLFLIEKFRPLREQIRIFIFFISHIKKNVTKHSLQCRRYFGAEYGTQISSMSPSWIGTGCLTGGGLVQRQDRDWGGEKK